MKKHLSFCAFFFCTVFFCHAAEYFAGEGVTDLKVCQDGTNGAYIFYIQQGNIKSVHENSDGIIKDFKLFSDSDMEPVNVSGLIVNEISQNVVMFIGEVNGSFYFFSKFIDDKNNRNLNDWVEIGKSGDSFSSIKTIRNFSDGSIRYFFLRNGQLVCCTVDLSNGKIISNVNLTEPGVNVTEYSVIVAKDKLLGYYVAAADVRSLILFVSYDSTFNKIYSEQIEKETKVTLQSSILSDTYCMLQSDAATGVLKYVDGVFQKIHTDKGCVQYPLLWLGNEDFSKKITTVQKEEENIYIINDDYQTCRDYTYFTAVPSNTKKAYVLYKNKNWNMAVTDFTTTARNNISVPDTAEYISTVYDTGCRIVFLDRKTNQVDLVITNKNDICKYISLQFSEEKQILSDIVHVDYDGGAIILSDEKNNRLLINSIIEQVRLFSSDLFNASVLMNGQGKIFTYTKGYINVQENDYE